MSYLLSLDRIQRDSGRAKATWESQTPEAGEVLRSTPPSPVSGLIAEIFGDGKNFSRQPVLFSAAEPGAGVTWTASAVAAELAAGGRKVLLAEASVIASLSKHEDVVELCDRVGPDLIWVLGPKQACHSAFPVSGARGRPLKVLSALRAEFPYIILDSPALSRSDVALRLAPLTAGAVLVLRKAKTETRDVLAACKKFTTIGSQVLGCVYNAR